MQNKQCKILYQIFRSYGAYFTDMLGKDVTTSKFYLYHAAYSLLSTEFARLENDRPNITTLWAIKNETLIFSITQTNID